MMSAIVRNPCSAACGDSVRSACSRTPGLVSLTICSQKSTPTRLSWKMLWSNMYSDASPRLTIHSPHRGGADPEGHVLGVAGAGGVVVAADPADPAGDEVGVAGVLALHEDAVAAEDRRGAVALDDLALGEVDLGVDAQAAHDPRDRVPRHLHQAVCLLGSCCGRHGATSTYPCSRLEVSARVCGTWA